MYVSFVRLSYICLGFVKLVPFYRTKLKPNRTIFAKKFTGSRIKPSNLNRFFSFKNYHKITQNKPYFKVFFKKSLCTVFEQYEFYESSRESLYLISDTLLIILPHSSKRIRLKYSKRIRTLVFKSKFFN